MAVSSPDHQPQGLSRSLLFLLAGAGIGLAFGLRMAPAPSTHVIPTPPTASEPADSPSAQPKSEPDAEPPEPEPQPSPPTPQEPSEAMRAAVALTQHELGELARALSDPSAYKTVHAVLRDVAAYEAARRRRDELLVGPWAERLREPLPALPAGLRERAAQLEGSQDRQLVLPVSHVPEGWEYSPLAGLSSSGVPGVVLSERGGVRTVLYQVRHAGGEQHVEVTEDVLAGADVLRVSTLQPDGQVAVVRVCSIGPPGWVWSTLLADLFARGEVAHEALQRWISQPLDRSQVLGWLDWVRRSLPLPPNPDRGEESGAGPPALHWRNPLLLRDAGAAPIVFNRPGLTLSPTRSEPPLPAPARGPLLLIASNGLALHDGQWSWLVFDAEQRRVVHHVRSAAGHIRWEHFPDATQAPPGREAERFAALTQRAVDRTRQVLTLLTLRRELSSLETELENTVGGLYSRDGLEACRLRGEIISRTERVQALSHLLLDEAGIRRADRSVEEAKRSTLATLVAVIEAMIDAGRSGPVEYLLRDEELKAILFKAPQSYRLRLVRKFGARFRPFGTRLRLLYSGHTPRWYESLRWFEED